MNRLWIGFVLVLVVSFSILGWIGTRIDEEAPPLVNKVVTSDGRVVIDAGEIQRGQNVWQSLGGMEVGSAKSMPGGGAVYTSQFTRRCPESIRSSKLGTVYTIARPGRRWAKSAVTIADMPELKTSAPVAPGSSGATWSSRISAFGWLKRE